MLCSRYGNHFIFICAIFWFHEALFYLDLLRKTRDPWLERIFFREAKRYAYSSRKQKHAPTCPLSLCEDSLDFFFHASLYCETLIAVGGCTWPHGSSRIWSVVVFTPHDGVCEIWKNVNLNIYFARLLKLTFFVDCIGLILVFCWSG